MGLPVSLRASPLQRDLCGQDLVRAVAGHDLKVAVFKDKGFIVPEGEHPVVTVKETVCFSPGARSTWTKSLSSLTGRTAEAAMSWI